MNTFSEEAFDKISNMWFSWDEVMLILNEIGKKIVFISETGELITRHSQNGKMICTFDSTIFSSIDNYTEKELEKYKKILYEYDGLHSSLNVNGFYNYLIERKIK
jgi:hypothetical protein